MTTNIIKNQDGVTIIEVLVGAVVFMIGFSILVFMLNQMISNYSVNDLTSATRLASKSMEMTITYQDTISYDSTINVSNIDFGVKKTVQIDNDLAKIYINVARSSTKKELCSLYGEFIFRQN
ncbi:MAG: prepilin-type N-terminal cleavage/methylation domain-containing protein [candidate division Zixibacteria bacterium]